MKKKRGENVSTVEYNDYVQLRGLMKDIAVGGDSFDLEWRNNYS